MVSNNTRYFKQPIALMHSVKRRTQSNTSPLNNLLILLTGAQNNTTTRLRLFICKRSKCKYSANVQISWQQVSKNSLKF